MSSETQSGGPDARSDVIKKKAVLFVPFWRMVGHVGNNRIDRFVRWLSEEGYYVVIVCAGLHESVRSEPWGQEITVIDRLGLHPETTPELVGAVSPRRPNKLRRKLAYLIFNPDPAIVWARAAARHQKVVASLSGASFILSSSPPESAHVGAWLLSKKTGVPHIVDMRDGWLDEPLKPLLLSSVFRRWLEGRLETRILRDAKTVQVTSDVWLELLVKRFPELKSKVIVLTNGYPKLMPMPPVNDVKNSEADFVLIHAGRFLGSRLTQMPHLLLEPLFANLSLKPVKGVICLLGSLSEDELRLIEMFRLRFSEIGWRLECPGNISRERLLERLMQADGLLLLSASNAAIPSKIFEYIPTGLPIFLVSSKGSAAWRIGEKLPQASLVEVGCDLNNPTCDFHLRLENRDSYQRRLPSNFSEEFLRETFLASIALSNDAVVTDT